MIINDDRRFVFLGIPRTANRAMHRVLLTVPGSIHFRRLHTMEIPHEAREYFTFCAVRNPYRRFLAYYLWRRSPHPWGSDAAGMTFEQYIEAMGGGILGPCTVRGHTGGNRLDAVIRYEGLPDAFAHVVKRLELGLLEMPFVGERLSRHWHRYYTPKTADRVYELTRDDFEEFGYDRDSWRSTGQGFE